MASILNKVSALGASRQLAVAGSGLQQTIERLATGPRMSRAPEEVGSTSLGSKLGAHIRLAGQGKRNAADAATYLKVAGSALGKVSNLLTRAAELSQQAQAGTLNEANRRNLDGEFQRILSTIMDLGTNTKFNGVQVFTADEVVVAVGGVANIAFKIGTLGDLHGSASDILLFTEGIDLGKVPHAFTAASRINAALDAIGALRTRLGASQNQLMAVSNALGIEVENFTAACSQFRDAVLADEVVNLAKFQILNQSGAWTLGQPSPAQQQILALLR